VVLHQAVGGVGGHGEHVAGTAGIGVGRVVDVAVAQDTTEAAVDADAVAHGPVGLDTFDPGGHRQAQRDVGVLAAAHVEVFHAGVAGTVGDGPARELRGVGGVEGDVQRCGEGDGAGGQRGDLEHLADGPVVTCEPAASRTAGSHGCFGAPIDVGVVGQLV